ncbi:PREDICTED: sodium-coupled neutral amino acid transporter 9-like isoform X2 [Priapulus caudatus]|uniref:Sodium-coupled neutral amino acid transporter 9-like isoform X2 n=1 Tax=Priapulus caudatus TaxID=37621 RepID=A0ABM1EIU7_PRICU|nr:PREDICTED: sodium-coupled neutral amino acid transporter 9-like isoform X2 [Priapulus caudatus]
MPSSTHSNSSSNIAGESLEEKTQLISKVTRMKRIVSEPFVRLYQSTESITSDDPGPSGCCSRSVSVSNRESGRDEAKYARKPFYVSPYEDNRKPYYYTPLADEEDKNSDQKYSARTQATLSRYRYYSKLTPPSDKTLVIPSHIIPAQYYSLLPIPALTKGKQGSIVLIFSVWNTMMGTSILSMPWALHQAGFLFGLFLMLFMAAISLYTCYRVLKSPQQAGVKTEILEFSDIVALYLDQYYGLDEESTGLDSVIAPTCGNAVCHISNYHGGDNPSTISPATISPDDNDTFGLSNFATVAFTATSATPNYTTPSYILPANFRIYESIWNEVKTVPLYLVILLLPLMNFKSPTFFTKFNSLGTLSVAYLIIFVSLKTGSCGVHFDFETIPQIRTLFPALTGILALAYFIHNAIISIMRNQKKPENNARDLTIAYILVAATYVFVASAFYIMFPLDKGCIQDNFLNNFRGDDVLTFAARVGLLFQMTTVFPLIAYIFRIQVMHALFGSIYPSLKHVVMLNVLLSAICILFARFLPQIGTIIRFCGSFSGLAYIFTLPGIVYMMEQKRRKCLTNTSIFLHCIIIGLGVLNFVGQFVILGAE